MKAANKGQEGGQFNVGMKEDRQSLFSFFFFLTLFFLFFFFTQILLGLHYEYGYGVPQDYKKAMDWYLKAAEQGHSRSQNSIGM